MAILLTEPIGVAAAKPIKNAAASTWMQATKAMSRLWSIRSSRMTNRFPEGHS
jgi:hypothetical protein